MPLPIVDEATFRLPIATSAAAASNLYTLINAAAVGLNHLHGGRCSRACNYKPNACQRTALERICLKWWYLALGVINLEGDIAYDETVFSGLVHRKTSSSAAPLVATAVDVLDSCAQVDPMSFIPETLHSIIEDPCQMFDTGCHELQPDVAFTSGSRNEYILLLRKQYRAGKITLATACANAAQVFFLPKRSAGNLREVWNGSGLSGMTVAPPTPPWLASPSSLAMLESSDDRPLFISVRDGACFFDQLRVPQALQPYLGKPYTTIGELCASGIDSSGNLDFAPLGESDFAEATGILGNLSPETRIYPLLNSWPMGHSWSSTIAQHVMTSTCITSGLSPQSFLCESSGLSAVSDASVSVAFDDIILFERGAHNEIASGFTAPFFSKLDDVWSKAGIRDKPEKRTDRQCSAEALGLQLMRGTHLLPKTTRIFELICSMTYLLRTKRTSQQFFATFFGVLQWSMLVNRPLLSACSHVYSFLDASNIEVENIPQQVLGELGLIATLLFATVVDLRAGWTPFVWATDGAEDYGYGGASASCEPAETRRMASYAHIDGHQFVPFDCWPGGSNLEVSESCIKLPMRAQAFKTRFSLRSQQQFHASKLEAGAVGIALKYITRRPCNHGCRTLMLIDAQALMHAARKGRSSAANFVHGLRVIVAHSLAADIRVHYGYIASRHNPADGPSRGQGRPKSSKTKVVGGTCQRRSRCEEYLHEMKRSIRRCIACGTLPGNDAKLSWTSSCSSSKLGQPSMT